MMQGGQVRIDLVRQEEAAWQIAIEIAGEFRIAPSDGYPDMPRSTRLEFGLKPGAISEYLFISEVLRSRYMEIGTPEKRYSVLHHETFGYSACRYRRIV